MALDIANTVLNASPYFDDYNEDKNFHRVLFRPSVAVQARELNQVQSILQNQIERFGQHIFKDGTIIKGCGLSYLNRIDYVSINDQFDTNTSLSSTNSQFVNAIAVGSNSGVVARLFQQERALRLLLIQLDSLFNTPSPVSIIKEHLIKVKQSAFTSQVNHTSIKLLFKLIL